MNVIAEQTDDREVTVSAEDDAHTVETRLSMRQARRLLIDLAHAVDDAQPLDHEHVVDADRLRERELQAGDPADSEIGPVIVSRRHLGQGPRTDFRLGALDVPLPRVELDDLGQRQVCHTVVRGARSGCAPSVWMLACQAG